MKPIYPILLLLLATAGCSQKAAHYAAAPEPAAGLLSKSADRSYLAYRHEVQIETGEDKVAVVFHTIEDLCAKDAENACNVLDSRIAAGAEPSASITVRAKAAGIRKIVEALGKEGDVASQSTSADDLAAPIQDTARKLEMLTDYRAKLEALRGRANNDIESLIKINKELAETQSQIEALSGEQARLTQRVETEVLDVSVTAQGHRSSWHPVGEAVKDFMSNLSQGAAGAITGLAYAIPWMLVLLALGAVSRFVWRRWRGSKKG